ncbi:hypothetical protein G7K_2673-t1 [Saitoella complicata NRRL Y-17804]|uniref:Uncharacterized protein n=1 Tax=Saitoella complicata (strain BCRC 22490 / CBS 7301 / JCM 7358 / NBRC 10748 / NRRL Y-17804) TaxID=698492 RepID=A0A0E9NGG9_SAICN|nr:hypothetical protein G7K_2673-t1 [Saitoella complicata NRRL Y-17804]
MEAGALSVFHALKYPNTRSYAIIITPSRRHSTRLLRVRVALGVTVASSSTSLLIVAVILSSVVLLLRNGLGQAQPPGLLVDLSLGVLSLQLSDDLLPALVTVLPNGLLQRLGALRSPLRGGGVRLAVGLPLPGLHGVGQLVLSPAELRDEVGGSKGLHGGALHQGGQVLVVRRVHREGCRTKVKSAQDIWQRSLTSSLDSKTVSHDYRWLSLQKLLF